MSKWNSNGARHECATSTQARLKLQCMARRANVSCDMQLLENAACKCIPPSDWSIARAPIPQPPLVHFHPFHVTDVLYAARQRARRRVCNVASRNGICAISPPISRLHTTAPLCSAPHRTALHRAAPLCTPQHSAEQRSAAQHSPTQSFRTALPYFLERTVDRPRARGALHHANGSAPFVGYSSDMGHRQRARRAETRVSQRGANHFAKRGRTGG